MSLETPYVVDAIGADPEVFVLSKEGRFSSPNGLGTKRDPRPVEGGTLQKDNIMAEFAINPSRSEEEFHRNIESSMTSLSKILAEQELKISRYSVARLTKTRTEFFLRNDPDFSIFGCNPVENAETMETIPFDAELDVNEKGHAIRLAAGHIHVSFNEPSLERCLNVVRAMSAYLYLPMIAYDYQNGGDTVQLARSKFHIGNPLNYRRKPYGIEYTPLSNQWVHTTKRRSWIFRNAIRAVQNAGAFTVDRYTELLRGENPLTFASNYAAYQQLSNKIMLEAFPV